MPIYNGTLTNELNGSNLEALLKWDANLFSNFRLPEGLSVPVAVATIREKHGLAPLYKPNPYWMRLQIGIWVERNWYTWSKLAKTLTLVYNPIWNTDVQEKTVDVRTIDRDTTGHRTESGYGVTDGVTHGEADGNATVHNEGNAHDSAKGTSYMQEDGNTAGHTWGTTHEDSQGTMYQTTDTVNDTLSTELFTGKQTSDTTTDTETNGEKHVTGNTDEKRFVSPENSADYQPDTHAVTDTAEDTTTKETVHGVTHGVVDTLNNTTGTVHATGNSTTNGSTTGKVDGSHDDNSTGEHHQTNNGATTSDAWNTHAEDTTTHTHETTDGTAKQQTKSIGTSYDKGTEDVLDKLIHTWDRGGNIGITSTQQLINAERQVAMYSIYEVIADSFFDAFCLSVY